MAEVSDIWIKLNYWFLNNRQDLKRWWVLLLIALDVFLVVYVVTNGVVTAISFRQTNDWIVETGTSRIVGSDAYARISPTPLELGAVETFEVSTDTEIPIAVVTNPNTLWAVTRVQYSFSGSQGTTQVRSSVLVPGASTVFLGNTDVGNNPELVIESIDWERAPANSLPLVPLTFSPGTHTTIITSDAGSAKAISQISTTVTNNSLFNIREARGTLLVRNGATLVGARQFFIDNITPREERVITVQFQNTLAQFDTIIFFSEVDIFDPNMLEV